MNRKYKKSFEIYNIYSECSLIITFNKKKKGQAMKEKIIFLNLFFQRSKISTAIKL